MPGQRDSISNILKVAVKLCLACAFLVSSSAVLLRPRQTENRKREERKNVLIAADGIFDPKQHTDDDVARLFETVEVKMVDLAGSDWYVEPPDGYIQKTATQKPEQCDPVPAEKDFASIRKREKLSYVYLVNDENGRPDQVVLPIRGYGLWSTLYGFISIDLQSLKQGPEHAIVRGLTYYQHAETPGLGGEVDNPDWKRRWQGKLVFDENWNVLIEVTKRITEPEHQIDALSGATITSDGVTNMMRYWLGPEGFGPYLKKLHEELR
jgi:Na+-transporting NADH:ubiquinone oxidoreductase subunit C